MTKIHTNNLQGINRLSNEPDDQANTSLLVPNPKGFTLSQNTELPKGEQDRSFRDNNMSESLGLPLYLSQNNQPQNPMEEVIAGMQSATLGGDLRINHKKQNFISLDQSKLLNQTNVNQSDGSLGEIYEKTLSAFQNDLHYLQEINQTREEIGARL